ncbi:MAG: outer membrane protein assembly factor BamD [Bacteroidota bacterium]
MKKGFVFLLLVFVMASCSKFQRLTKNPDMEAKYQGAVKYYEKKDYYHALQLFEELIAVYRGTSKAEDSYYYYAYCTFYVDDYQTAAYYFNNFVQTFPNSKHAEEAQYMYAYCYYLDSPISSLDQTSTLEAIEKFQLFINRYPKGEKVTEANNRIDELRKKLEDKAFDIAKLWFDMEEYKASVVAFDNLLTAYPGTEYKELALFTMLKAQFIYASKSVEAKKEERFKNTLDIYYKLVDNFPQSRYLRDAEKIFDDSKTEIKKLENQVKHS